MPARRSTPRTRYDGAVFRHLRETYKVGLTTVLHTAAQHDRGEVCTHEHVRQWERGQRNISDRLARILANALADTSGVDIKPADFIAHRVAA